MKKNWIVESRNVLSNWVTKILVCNYKGLNEVCHFSFNCENEVLKKYKNAVGVWQIKTLK